MMNAGAAEPTVARDPGHQALDDLIRSFPAALLTTVDPQGIMHTRQLPNTNTEFKGDLWFISSRGAPLIQEVSQNSGVLVTYAERPSGRFMVASGVAHVRHDPERVKALWHPVLASWMPAGPDDTALSLIQVSVASVELWD